MVPPKWLHFEMPGVDDMVEVQHIHKLEVLIVHDVVIEAQGIHTAEVRAVLDVDEVQ